jgi:hypothetical protein
MKKNKTKDRRMTKRQARALVASIPPPVKFRHSTPDEIRRHPLTIEGREYVLRRMPLPVMVVNGEQCCYHLDLADAVITVCDTGCTDDRIDRDFLAVNVAGAVLMAIAEEQKRKAAA